MTITASMVNALREKTGVGMMKCKEALTACDGDIEKAIEFLRKQGAAVAAKRADKDANEGVIFVGLTDSKAFAFELTCETDFVAKGDDFQKLGADIVSVLKEKEISSVENLMEQCVGSVSVAEKAKEAVEHSAEHLMERNAGVGSLTVADRVQEVLAKIGEKIEIRKLNIVNLGANEAAAVYSHLGGKIGSVVKVAYKGSASKDAVAAIAKTLALHVTASNPSALNESELSPELVAKEREIAKEQVVNEGKTKAEFLDRAVEGRVKKALKQFCLLDQEFYTDAKKTVTNVLEEEQKKLGLESLSVVQFVRLEKGK